MEDHDSPLPLDPLTPRELEILRLVADGLSNQAIAEKLVISLQTAKWYIKQIYSKLQVGSRTQAVAAARAAGLLGEPPPTIAAPGTPKHNLPHQPTPFLGRREEINAITTQLANPACRLLTLVGPGGIGKTRLALRVAELCMGQFLHGVYFVSLAPVGSPHLTASAIASALNFTLHGGETPAIQILDYVREKELLLVLDNFEHLLEGVGWIADLVAAAPRIKLLVTSRERLNLQEEWLIQVQGMEWPSQDVLAGLENYSAVQLFFQQAQRVQRGFSLATPGVRQAVISICQLTEGLPLGIELAATWMRVMPAQQIAQQIARDPDFLVTSSRNIPERHRSIRALFEYSWNLLSPNERSVLMKLSIFRGGFTLEAAQQVAGSSIAALVALIDKSLVIPERDGRYDMHELVRQYALDKLVESGEAERVGNAHLDFFLNFAQEAKPMLEATEQGTWLRRLEPERDNFRAALAWSRNYSDLESGLRLGAALWLFWFMRGYLLEGREYLEKFLDLAGDTAPAARAEAFDKAGVLARYQGDYARAYYLVNKGLSIFRELGDKQGIANSLANLGFVALYQDNRALSRSLYNESLIINRELDNGQGVADSLSHLALAAFFDGDYVTARSLDEQSLAIWRSLGDRQGIAWALHCLGNLTLLEDSNAAWTIFAESLTISSDLGYRWGLAWSFEDFARLATLQRKFERALCLAGAAYTLRESIGIPLPPPERAEFDLRLESARKAVGKEVSAAAWARGQALTIDQALIEIGELGPQSESKRGIRP